MSSWEAYFPTRVRFGWGRLSELGEVVDELGGGKVFLVTGRRSARESGSLDRVQEILQGRELTLFDRAEENPTIATVDEGAALCKEEGCRVVIGLGGGSALDAAKAVAMLQKNPGSVREYLDGEKTCWQKGLPMVTIPTTSGTGSEVTPFAVITHPEKKAKPAIAPVQMFPDTALVDPQLTASMPFKVAVSSGLDALDQAVEGFWSTRANPFTRALSGRGIVLAIRNLEKACRDKDRESLSNMALASNLTGIQMSQVANTAIHPLSYPFTMDYEVPHGFACAVFLPVFIRHNADSVREIFSDVLAMLGLASPEAFADEVEGLMERLQAPTRLGEFGVEDGLLSEMVKRGIGKSTEWNPRSLKEEDLLDICRRIL